MKKNYLEPLVVLEKITMGATILQVVSPPKHKQQDGTPGWGPIPS